ncbi:hypothetical protein K438DRAFT_18586 [Mycena galopus ATCC 62051]|nr:hypothetical protein K438DRAFT_18586 [Mycena galopus ATCC 62051]
MRRKYSFEGASPLSQPPRREYRPIHDRVEGERDDSPIRLEGDTLDEVRAFFSFCYARCMRFRCLQRFVCARRFAHKYQLKSVETWASETLLEVASRNARRTQGTCSIEAKKSILRFSKFSSSTMLLRFISDAWLANSWRVT